MPQAPFPDALILAGGLLVDGSGAAPRLQEPLTSL
jgi:hypothetical protein